MSHCANQSLCEPPSLNKSNDGDNETLLIGDDEFANESDLVHTHKLYRIPLIPVDASFGLVEPLIQNVRPLQTLLLREQKRNHTDVTVLFAVRNVGCGGCREHAQQVASLTRESRVSVAAVVKETGIDDQSLIKFHQEYFARQPLYKDEQWKVFKAMGGEQLSVWNILKGVFALKTRLDKKKIESVPSKGDFWTQGGVMVFNKKGHIVFTHREKFGEEFDMEAIHEAIRKANNEQ